MMDFKIESIEDVFHNDEWSPERQIQETVRRRGLYRQLESEQVYFKPLPDTVIVTVPPKCGMTWLLHICHQIRMCGADPDFEYQTNVITWIELAEKVYSLDPATMPQPANSHILATHLQYPLVPKGGKIIYCFREQKDMAVSAYYFLDSFLFLKGRVSLHNFCLAGMKQQQVEQNLHDLLFWWEHRDDDNILLFFFDDLMEDHAGCVHRIAKFIGVDCGEDALTRVVHTTAHKEMAHNHHKFDSHTIRMEIVKKAGDTPLPENECIERVCKNGGRSGDGRQLPAEFQHHIDQLWQEIVTPKLGFANLHEMRKAWHVELLLI